MTDNELMIEMVSGFPVHMGYAYDLTNHLWVDASTGERVRIGMDALGLETSGTLAQLLFDDEGSDIVRGAAFGTLEAEKFVGPLVCPVSGRIVAVNEAAMANPVTVQADPYDAGWMIEVGPLNLAQDLELLITGRKSIVAGFEQKIRQYRVEGVLAE